MAEDHESLYKRSGDYEWRKKVDHEQITLMTGHQVLERRVSDLEDAQIELDEVLRGDAQKDTAGLIARLHKLETDIAKLNAVIFMDVAGGHGILQDVKDLKEGRQDRRENRNNGWKYLTAVTVAAITSGYLTLMWPQIKRYMAREEAKDPVEQLIEKAKRPKHHRHIVIREISPDSSEEN